jgi:hypothetical protein
MDLTSCPYDGADFEAEMVSGGSIRLVCPVCGREWESHGAWSREVHVPSGAPHRDDDALPGDDITITE